MQPSVARINQLFAPITRSTLNDKMAPAEDNKEPTDHKSVLREKFKELSSVPSTDLTRWVPKRINIFRERTEVEV